MPLRAHLPTPIRGCLGATASSDQTVAFGHHLIKGKSRHAMEDYFVAEVKKVNNQELGLFAIYDGHLGHNVADYLQKNLFDNILKANGFWKDPKLAIKEAYLHTDGLILEKAPNLGPGGSTAVTAILINSKMLYVANVGDSRAIISKGGEAKQLSIDHEPGNSTEKEDIMKKGGFVSNMPGDVPRVDGQLAVARAFGDKSLKAHLSVTPDIKEVEVDVDTELLILASDGLWKVMKNQEAVDLVKKIKDPTAAAKQLAQEAVNRKSKDDISCIVVRFI